MAGNIVKWWKHKILGGYKQFSVQECTTDSEELMYHQVRAPSSCSAPPDLLLVSDRENNIPLKSPVVNIISATSPAGSASAQKHQQQHHHSHLHQQQQHQQISAHSTPKDVLSKNSKNGGGGGKMHQQQCGIANGKQMNNAQTQHSAADASAEQGKDDRIHLEEFTCDVSVESGKSTQPLQFSFTFYDLDGHHGKITKDDIVGIVYTIYESIGKSVVVPHCGSKTINVRLTVSPEGKSKAAAAAAANSAVTTSKFRKGMGHSMRDSAHQTAHGGHSRRQHRYRPRKLVKTDDEDDDSTSEKEAVKKPFNSSKAKCCQQPPVQAQPAEVEPNPVDVSCTGHENIYENMTNLKEECKRCLTQQEKSELYLKQASSRVKMLRKARKQKYQDHCHETRQRSLSVGNESCWKIRANNSIKTHNAPQTDNNTQTQSMGAVVAATAAGATTSPDQDCVDGMVGGSSHNTHSQVNNTSTATAECWNNALNRNDLIDIIRESMEKNRLCFQSNGKPQANVSPIRHRQRSNTVSKIPTSTSNNNNNNHHNPSHSNNIISTNNNIINNNNNIDSTAITHQQQHPHESNNTHSHHHLQPHIPIYHQQMAINPAVLAAQNGIVHSKMNLCGYDSFLHATICSGGTSHSPPPPTPNTAAPNTSLIQPQPVATVQPIMTSSPKIYVSNQVKTSKILRNSTSTHHQHHSQQNSPQFQGYHRLSSGGNHSAAKLNISLLSALSPNLSNQEKFHQTIEHVEKWLTERDRKLLKNASGAVDEKSKKDVKNYDNLLFAKLTEKLQQQQLLQETVVGQRSSGNKENIRRMHNSQNHNVKMHDRQRSHHHHQQQLVLGAHASSTSGSSGTNSEKFLNSNSSKYVTLIPINGDPLECENLLHQTSDDETSTIPRTLTPPNVVLPPTVAKTTVATALTATPAATASASAAGVTAGTTTTTADNGTPGTTTTVSGAGDEGRSSSSTSSLIHRYVHEHIHHHYHHFENKDE